MLIRRRGGTNSLHFALLAALVLAAGLAGPAAAQEAGVYVVSGVKVDATADTVTQARSQAMAQGQSKAFDLLMQRLVPSQDLPRVPAIGSNEVDSLVTDFSVANERTSDVRYLADMTVRFQPDAVRSFLQRAGIDYAETQARPIVVLPLYKDADGWRLWDSPNPWHEAWLKGRHSNDLVPLEAPLGDIDDVIAVDAEAALAGDSSALQAIAGRYDAAEVLIARAQVSGDPAVIDIEGQRMLGDGGQVSDQVTQAEGEDLADALVRATDRLAAAMQGDWKAQNVLRFGSESQLTADVPIQSLNEWMDIRSRLQSLPQIRRVDIVYMTRGQVRVNLTYLGDQQALSQVLAQRNLSLTPESQGKWSLGFASGAAPRLEENAPLTAPAEDGALNSGGTTDSEAAPDAGTVAQ
ncbi:MAG: DUF2066 domain-containing protein [Rhodovibrionaceae bacterium]